MLAEDMLDLFNNIEMLLGETLKEYGPKLELSGSMEEGTRLGLANELDLGLIFKSLKMEDSIPFKVGNDPFSLKKSETSPAFLDKYFNDQGEFHFYKFKHFLLEVFSTVIDDIFDIGKLRGTNKLQCITKNKQWAKGETKCKGESCKNLMMTEENTNFEHCKECAVTVSQTKIGIALQFGWVWVIPMIDLNQENPCMHSKVNFWEENSWLEKWVRNSSFKEGQKINIYCSIDIIPEFPIEPINAVSLAKMVNSAMLSMLPRGWLKYLSNYKKHYKLIQDLIQCEEGKIESVVLKTINFHEEKYHHVRPAQPSTKGVKFQSDRMKEMYCYIKYLKKLLDLDLSSFWVKKELLKPEYQSIMDMNNSGFNKDDNALVQVLCKPEFKSKVEDKLDVEESCSYISLKQSEEDGKSDK